MVRHYTLSDADIAMIRRCRGGDAELERLNAELLKGAESG
jgi:hypothetical protein